MVNFNNIILWGLTVLESNNHILTIFEREKLEVSQAEEIISSTEKEIFIKLEKEVLQILGEGLKINKLIPENKTLSVTGKINGINYISKMAKKSLFKKVFK